ncbi:MAG: MBL fold metallo-hydrolase [Gammaproteobacteria bacterium]|nr:MBL fold metallo-hydrolase [Gammaproteobacteria bacterium]
MPFNHDYPFEYAVVERVSPLIRRVVARNPGPFTFKGTGTFIIGEGEVAIVDPGPAIDEHVEALLEAVRNETVTHLIVTHTHNDHSPACAPVAAATGARSYGYGPHGSGALERGVQVEEGGDMAFVPDVHVRDGDIIEGRGWSLECVYTPGHTSNHMCYQLREERALFSGDHVMGWNTTIVSPPDGDMYDYMHSLRKLIAREDLRFWPTHGPAIDKPQAYVQAYLDHRLDRAEQCLVCLREGVEAIPDMVKRMYVGLDPRMHPAAARSTLATLMYLEREGRVRCLDEPGSTARYRLS